ncbi:MAG: DUF507 family protein [Nitrospirae bacterium]|nr:DUF507 family protein [Nitrospirota bacterium]
MRIPKGWLTVISREILKELLDKDFVELKTSENAVRDIIFEAMLAELMVEDTLNDEVRDILKKFDSEIEKGNLDYRTLFDMTKKKLVKERNIIL